MDVKELKERIKSGSLGGAYLFVGEEEYLKRYYMSELRRATVTDEAFAPLNHSAFDGPETERAAVLEAIESPPMMQDFKLVEWKYAEIGTGRGCITAAALAELAERARENGYTVFSVLISDPDFDIGTLKRPSKAITALGKSFDILRFDKSTDTQLMAWMKRHFDSHGITVTREVLEEMLRRIGKSMDTLGSEVDKLAYLARSRGKGEVSVDDVKEASSRNTESEAFDLQNALSERNKKLAFRALLDLKNRKVEPVIVINSLAAFYSEILTVAAFLDEGMEGRELESSVKIHPYRLKMCVAAAKRYGTEHITRASRRLSEIDTASKLGGARGYTAIEIFISEYI